MTGPAASLHLADMTWPEIAAAASRNCPVVLTIGACEQHGPAPAGVHGQHPPGRRRRAGQRDRSARHRSSGNVRRLLPSTDRRRGELPRHRLASRRDPDGVPEGRAVRAGEVRLPADRRPELASGECRLPVGGMRPGISQLAERAVPAAGEPVSRLQPRRGRGDLPARLPGMGGGARVRGGDVDDDGRPTRPPAPDRIIDDSAERSPSGMSFPRLPLSSPGAASSRGRVTPPSRPATCS